MCINRSLLTYMLITLVALGGITVTGCSSDDSSKVEELKSPYLICAKRNPGGVGIDLDTGEAFNLDDAPDMDWDIKLKVYKGWDKVTNPTAPPTKNFARPYIALRGKSGGAKVVEAATFGSTGQTAYDGIQKSAVTSLAYGADTIDDVDKSKVTKEKKEIAGNTEVFYIYKTSESSATDTLKYQYDQLQIGEKFKKNCVDKDHTNDPIYIIKTDKGNYFKVIIQNFGPKSDLKEKGKIALEYKKL